MSAWRREAWRLTVTFSQDFLFIALKWGALPLPAVSVYTVRTEVNFKSFFPIGAISNPKNWIAKERLSFIGRAAYWRGRLQKGASSAIQITVSKSPGNLLCAGVGGIRANSDFRPRLVIKHLVGERP